jgi:hypothetical protein
MLKLKIENLEFFFFFYFLYISSSSKACPLCSGFPSPKTKFRHLSLSLVSSSLSPWFVVLRLTPSIHLSLGLPLLRVPSKIFSGSLFPFCIFYIVFILNFLFLIFNFNISLLINRLVTA